MKRKNDEKISDDFKIRRKILSLSKKESCLNIKSIQEKHFHKSGFEKIKKPEIKEDQF